MLESASEETSLLNDIVLGAKGLNSNEEERYDVFLVQKNISNEIVVAVVMIMDKTIMEYF